MIYVCFFGVRTIFLFDFLWLTLRDSTLRLPLVVWTRFLSLWGRTYTFAFDIFRFTFPFLLFFN
jgi:hypothetical protein